MVKVSEALAMALGHFQAGRPGLTEEICTQVLQVDPEQAVANHLLGMVAHQAGRVANAEGFYRRAIQLNPEYAEAHSNLGVALFQQGRLDEAICTFQGLISLNPGQVEGYHRLATVLAARGRPVDANRCLLQALDREPNSVVTLALLADLHVSQGQLDQARSCYEQALKQQPTHAGLHTNLANVLVQMGDIEAAISGYKKGLELQPDLVQGHYNLGNAYMQQRMPDQAVACFKRAIQCHPDYAEAHNNLGIGLKEQGDTQGAITCFRRAVELKPNYVDAKNNLSTALTLLNNSTVAPLPAVRTPGQAVESAELYLKQGNALLDQRKPLEAIRSFRRAVALDSQFAPGYNSLGVALCMSMVEQSEVDEVLACFRKAISLKPDYTDAHNNLGIALKNQGRLDEAVLSFREAIKWNPGSSVNHSNLLYTQLFSQEETASSLYQEHSRWNKLHAEPLSRWILPHKNDRSPGRRLRVGYVSPDFYRHPVGRFMVPLLAAHDHQQFEIVCYSSVRIPDPMTDQCQTHSDVWRVATGQTDQQLADQIRADQIDILVDLTMHMSNNRLLTFARKPAPVQVTYLAYCGSTGLTTIDYRLTDPFIDPPGQHDRFYSEQSFRLPETYWCYESTPLAPAVNSLPAQRAGHVCFGSLNNFCKVTPQAFATWCQILKAVPNSTLLVHAHPGSHRQRARSVLAEHGVSPDRILFADFKPAAEYFETYHTVDIALDPFPYGGGTTTCDALWMGVPVVTLAGQTGVGRGGVSILSNVGLPELIAQSQADYVRIAADLSANLPHLQQLRHSLRSRMQASPLMDAPRFARNIESAYRTMWERWCEQSLKGTPS